SALCPSASIRSSLGSGLERMRTAKSARILVVGRPDHRYAGDLPARTRRGRDARLLRASGFDMSPPWGEQAFRGAEVCWADMLEGLPGVVGSLARRKGG